MALMNINSSTLFLSLLLAVVSGCRSGSLESCQEVHHGHKLHLSDSDLVFAITEDLADQLIFKLNLGTDVELLKELLRTFISPAPKLSNFLFVTNEEGFIIFERRSDDRTYRRTMTYDVVSEHVKWGIEMISVSN